MIFNLVAVENLCSNSCFLILFLTTIFYWWKIIFKSDFNYSTTGLLGYSAALVFVTLQLLLRWVESGHFPLSNLYESLLFLTWCFLGLYLYIETSTKKNFLGILISPAILCLIAFSDFSLPSQLQESHPLVPALQSNWLVMHVTVMIASYAALLVGCLVAIAYIIFYTFFSFSEKKNFDGELSLVEVNSPVEKNPKILQSINGSILSLNKSQNPATPGFLADQQNKNINFLSFLDNLSYRTIGIGFCFLTLGILSGAVWANETWGNYWSWDPKETWALITWLTFAIYLHTRLIVGWVGYKPACLASFGFVVIWICYLGVNLLGQGLHSYGFFQI